MTQISVNGLVLPDALCRALASGYWKVPENIQALREVFGERPVFPKFYSLELMISESASWLREDDDGYRGTPDDMSPPGDLDPTESVMIGDLGSDRPFALDYRPEGNPRVVFFAADEGKWRTVASSVEELLNRLKLLSQK